MTEGLQGKYIIHYADGSPVPDDGRKYFVLRYDSLAQHGKAARGALSKYCDLIRPAMPELATQLATDLAAEFGDAWVKLVEESAKREKEQEQL